MATSKPQPTSPPQVPSDSSWSASDVGHAALDVVGMIPVIGEPADAANAAWHASEGNYLEAGLSMVSVVPVVGDVVGKGGKLGKRFGGKLASKALDTLQTLDFGAILKKARNTPGIGPHLAKIKQALERWRDDLLKKFSKNAPVGKPEGCPLEMARTSTAKELRAKAAKAEAYVTPELSKLADANGMKMEGLEHSLKAEDSIARKLKGTPPDKMNDVLRYTMVAPEDQLAKSAANTLETLEKQGYEVLKVKDTFKPGTAYKGVNTQVKAPDGQVFELQFHTPHSYHVKDKLNHGIYEEARLLPDTHPEKAALNAKMQANTDSVAIPPGLSDSLGKYRK